MVKPDVKHNYYADLELPPTASVDDVRKAYRKLALLYHPDRNAGKEDESRPKFQAIQAANEVLGDASLKAKYDNDRRRAGFNAAFASRQPTTGNPYMASSQFPPPPSRTRPRTWQQQYTSTANTDGAGRFANFPKPAPTSRKQDPAQDRTNMFRAWQNMSNVQDRERMRAAAAQAHSQAPPQPQPKDSRPRPPPPPRPDSSMPSEEWIRANMNYRKPPPNVFDADGFDSRASAWAAYQQAQAGKPGMHKTNTFKTPKKQGYNPNAPGSDERAAPSAGSHYVQRHKSADFGRPEKNVPPPPPGPPPQTTPSSPVAAASPTTKRPPFRSRTFDEEVPFAEGNRERTPYSSFIGEKTEFSTAEQLPRARSSLDTTKLGPDEAAAKDRARSTSPLRRQPQQGNSKTQPFVVYSSSESESDADAQKTTNQPNGAQASQNPNPNRPKKTPTPPSRRFDATSNLASPPSVPVMPDANTKPQPTNAASGDDQKNNMYGEPSFSSNNPPTTSFFDPQTWLKAMSRSYSTSRTTSSPQIVPRWALPSSLSPTPQMNSSRPPVPPPQKRETFVTGADETYVNATKDERSAYIRLQNELRDHYGYVPDSLDMDIFFRLIRRISSSKPLGHKTLHDMLSRIIVSFPSIAKPHPSMNNPANVRMNDNSFTFPRGPEWVSSNTKTNSQENINTNFSGNGWSGNFTGEPDYFAGSENANQRPASPARRTGPHSKSSQRASTMDEPNPTGIPREGMPQRPWGSDGMPRISIAEPSPNDGPFAKEEWEKAFQNDNWTWPSQRKNPPSSLGRGTTGSTEQEEQIHKNSSTTDAAQPASVEDGPDSHDIRNTDGQAKGNEAGSTNFGDAMDIDMPPASEVQPITQPTQTGQEARVYSVPPSTWRQQQMKQQRGERGGKNSRSAHSNRNEPSFKEQKNINASLDDLRNVEPIAVAADGSGLKNLADLSASLPFQSQASTATSPVEVRELKLPAIPKVPEPPTTLTKASWPDFVQRFGSYLKAYHTFNGAMLQHFVAREAQVESQFAGGMSFLEAMGDTSGVLKGRTGYNAYSQAVLEDAKVREAWNMGCERHAEAVKTFANVRDRVRRLVVSGGLAGS